MLFVQKAQEPDRTFFSLPQEFHLQTSGSQAASCSLLACCRNAAEVGSLSPRWSQYPPVPLVSLLLQKSPWGWKTAAIKTGLSFSLSRRVRYTHVSYIPGDAVSLKLWLSKITGGRGYQQPLQIFSGIVCLFKLHVDFIFLFLIFTYILYVYVACIYTDVLY